MQSKLFSLAFVLAFALMFLGLIPWQPMALSLLLLPMGILFFGNEDDDSDDSQQAKTMVFTAQELLSVKRLAEGLEDEDKPEELPQEVFENVSHADDDQSTAGTMVFAAADIKKAAADFAPSHASSPLPPVTQAPTPHENQEAEDTPEELEDAATAGTMVFAAADITKAAAAFAASQTPPPSRPLEDASSLEEDDDGTASTMFFAASDIIGASKPQEIQPIHNARPEPDDLQQQDSLSGQASTMLLGRDEIIQAQQAAMAQAQAEEETPESDDDIASSSTMVFGSQDIQAALEKINLPTQDESEDYQTSATMAFMPAADTSSMDEALALLAQARQSAPSFPVPVLDSLVPQEPNAGNPDSHESEEEIEEVSRPSWLPRILIASGIVIAGAVILAYLLGWL